MTTSTDDYWYRRVGPTSWVAYNGRQGIWEASTEAELLTWLASRGIVARYIPLAILRVI